jgi:hypothetical protein
LLPEPGKRELREFCGTAKIIGTAFIVDCKLFAGVNAFSGVRNHFLPDFRRALVFTASFGHKR